MPLVVKSISCSDNLRLPIGHGSKLKRADVPGARAGPLGGFEFMGTDPTDTLASVTVRILGRNVGRSVALNVGIKGRMTFVEDVNELMQEQELICSGAEWSVPFPPVNIFPAKDGGERLVVYGAELVPRSTHKGLFLVPDGLTKVPMVSPKFLGCISYTIPSTSTPRHSNFLYGLKHREQGSSIHFPPDPLFAVSKDVPAKDLIIEAYVVGFDAN